VTQEQGLKLLPACGRGKRILHDECVIVTRANVDRIEVALKDAQPGLVIVQRTRQMLQ